MRALRCSVAQLGPATVAVFAGQSGTFRDVLGRRDFFSDNAEAREPRGFPALSCFRPFFGEAASNPVGDASPEPPSPASALVADLPRSALSSAHDRSPAFRCANPRRVGVDEPASHFGGEVARAAMPSPSAASGRRRRGRASSPALSRRCSGATGSGRRATPKAGRADARLAQMAGTALEEMHARRARRARDRQPQERS